MRWSLVRERAGDAKIMPKKKNTGKNCPLQTGRIRKNSAKGKKFPRSPLLDDVNYELQSHDSWNVLSRCRIKLRDFSQIIYQIVPYARDPLPVKFF